MQRGRRLAVWLVVGALAVLGLFLLASSASANGDPVFTPMPQTEQPQAAQAQPAVQGQNTSTDAEATSADADATNDASVSAGPGGGQASQIGDNDIRVNQSSHAKSGDAVAGSQIVGVVGGGHVTIQGQNSSDGAVAESGDASAENSLDIVAGPSSSGGGAQQLGDNKVRVNQTSVAESGDAVAGSQVTGLVDGDGVVQNQNSSEDPEAVSGDAEASNEAELAIGPDSEGLDGSGFASQIGDNDAVLEQSANAVSGDAVAGSGVTGGVGGGGFVQNQGTAVDAEAATGDAIAENVAEAVAGPSGFSDDGSAQSAQSGDNEVDVVQEANANSGDAVSGSQVTGFVSEELGHLTVQNQQSSDSPIAETGDAEATNELEVAAGPSSEDESGDGASAGQIGDNDVDVVQVADAVTGDAVAGGSVLGSVGGHGSAQVQNTSVDAEAATGDATVENVAELIAGPDALSDDGPAQAAQSGDNKLDVVQEGNAHSGDAVAGGSVIGAVGNGRGLNVQAQNASDGSVAESGDADVVNDVVLAAGPAALSDGDVAQASQVGDNDISFGQSADAVTGDAVAGGQVLGFVNIGSGSIQHQNTSDDDEAITADATAENSAEGSIGPLAESDDVTSVSQAGDNNVDADQDVVSVTGDAVAGSGIVGSVDD